MNEQIKKALTAIPVGKYELSETGFHKGRFAPSGKVLLLISVQTKEVVRKVQKRKAPKYKRERFKASILVERYKIETPYLKDQAGKHLWQQLSEKYNLIVV